MSGSGIIKARIVADSINEFGNRLRTFEVEYHRLILAEVNTHRMIGKNAASTRAIPLLKQIELISENPALPVFYGKNQSGMVADVELDQEDQEKAEAIILDMMRYNIEGVKKLHEIGLHKQSAGRYLEPWMTVKGVMTGTEWVNFQWLRNHQDAQPEIELLAKAIADAEYHSTPILLKPGQWHMPYYFEGYWIGDSDGVDEHGYTLEEAKMISMSCCAQVSYRKLDDSLEKARQVVARLNLDGASNDPAHSSPAEHQATPMDLSSIMNSNDWPAGVTAMHHELGPMSGNLAGWIQNRQLIPNHTKWKW